MNRLPRLAAKTTLVGLLAWQAALNVQDVLESDRNYIPVSTIPMELADFQFAIEDCKTAIRQYEGTPKTETEQVAGLIIGGSIAGFAALPVAALTCGREYFTQR